MFVFRKLTLKLSFKKKNHAAPNIKCSFSSVTSGKNFGGFVKDIYFEGPYSYSKSLHLALMSVEYMKPVKRVLGPQNG